MRRLALDHNRLCRRKALLFIVVGVGRRRVDFFFLFEQRRFGRREVDQLALRHGLW